MLNLSDFDFDLPKSLIAQKPLRNRSESRLLKVSNNELKDKIFSEIVSEFEPGDVLIFNDTKVMNARMFGRKETGGKIEILVEKIYSNKKILANLKTSKAIKPGSKIILSDDLKLNVCEKKGELFILNSSLEPLSIIDRFGNLPLPPYINNNESKILKDKYQTVYAKNLGAIAAPTAGLHFDKSIINSLIKKGIQCHWLTLHIGSGTFKPVRCRNLFEHKLHSEKFFLPKITSDAIEKAKSQGKKIIAVGTSCLRAIEASVKNGKLVSGENETDLFIKPGFEFQIVNRLLTNFHLPKSTLFVLVSTFAGHNQIKNAYRHAILNNYRFYSFGDAMIIDLYS